MRLRQRMQAFFHVRWRCLGGLLALTAMSMSGHAAAQAIRLEDAIRSAMTGNIVVRQQDVQVSGAEARLKEAGGAFDWTVGAESGYQTLYVPQSRNGVLTDQTQTIIAPYYSANVGRMFRNGISVRPGITAYPGSGVTAGQTMGLTQLRPSLGLTIPLLRGLGEENANATERAATESLKAAQFGRRFALERMVHDVVQTFWRCLATDQHAQIILESDRQATEYEAVLGQLAERGQVEPNVVQRATATNVSRHLSVDQAQNSVQVCHRDFGLAIGNISGATSPTPVGELPAMDNLGPTIEQLNQAALTDLAFSQRPDLRAVQQSIAAEGARRVGADDGKRPVLNLLLDPQGVILRYTQSLENNAGEGHAAAAAAAENEARLNLLQLQDKIRVDVSDALRNLRRSQSDWSAVSKAEHQMEQIVTDTERRAKAGATDRNDLLTAQDQIAQLRQQLVDIRLQFASSLAALRLATGTIDLVDRPAEMIAAQFLSLPVR